MDIEVSLKGRYQCIVTVALLNEMNKVVHIPVWIKLKGFHRRC